MTEQPSDYTWPGDTWWIAQRECPHCGSEVGDNGKIRVCLNHDRPAKDCEWWAKKETYQEPV